MFCRPIIVNLMAPSHRPSPIIGWRPKLTAMKPGHSANTQCFIATPRISAPAFIGSAERSTKHIPPASVKILQSTIGRRRSRLSRQGWPRLTTAMPDCRVTDRMNSIRRSHVACRANSKTARHRGRQQHHLVHTAHLARPARSVSLRAWNRSCAAISTVVSPLPGRGRTPSVSLGIDPKVSARRRFWASRLFALERRRVSSRLRIRLSCRSYAVARVCERDHAPDASSPRHGHPSRAEVPI